MLAEIQLFSYCYRLLILIVRFALVATGTHTRSLVVLPYGTMTSVEVTSSGVISVLMCV